LDRSALRFDGSTAPTCFGMPLFDGQQFLIRETYGIPTDHKVDYDHFSIPYEGQFDLIVANHMFTHAVRPREFFLEVRRRLNPGGHVYLYNEPDERDFLHDGKSIINTLNAFHLQTFDNASLVRALGACADSSRCSSRIRATAWLRWLALATCETTGRTWTPESGNVGLRRTSVPATPPSCACPTGCGHISRASGTPSSSGRLPRGSSISMRRVACGWSSTTVPKPDAMLIHSAARPAEGVAVSTWRIL
jgi:hypothetical protein